VAASTSHDPSASLNEKREKPIVVREISDTMPYEMPRLKPPCRQGKEDLSAVHCFCFQLHFRSWGWRSYGQPSSYRIGAAESKARPRKTKKEEALRCI
jgi:hypothetical protein